MTAPLSSSLSSRLGFALAAAFWVLLAASPAAASPCDLDTGLPAAACDAADMPAPPVISAYAERLVDDLISPNTPGWARLARVIQLDAPLSYLHPAQRDRFYAEAAQGLAALSRPSPEAHIAAAWIQLRALESRGDQDLNYDPSSALQAMGLVTRWQMLGPFENGNMSGFATAGAPEGPYAPKRAYTGKIGPVSWRPLAFQRMGYNALDPALSPDRSVFAYAATSLNAPKRQRAVLRMGTNGAYAVWVNGVEVMRQARDLGGSMDRDAVEVELQQGANTVLVKVGGENRGLLGFYMRWTDLEGRPLKLYPDPNNIPEGAVLARPSNGKPPRAVKAAADPAQVAATAAKAIAAPAEGAPAASPKARARATVDAALIARHLRPLDPKSPWRDLLDLGALRQARDPMLYFDVANLVDTHPEKVAMFQAAANTKTQAPLWVALHGILQLNQGIGLHHIPTYTAQLDQLTRASGAPTLLAHLVQARLLSRHNNAQAALTFLEPLLKTYPQNPALLAELRRLHNMLSHSPRAVALTRTLWEQRKTSVGDTVYLARALMRASDHRQALELTSQTLKARPDAHSLVALSARAAFNMGEREQGIALLTDALTRSPNHPDLLTTRGELYELMEAPKQAIASYNQALTVQPENRSLLERVQALRPQETSYEAPYRWSLDDLTPEPDAATKRAGQDFYILGQQEVAYVAPSGRTSRFNQRAVHVLTDEGARAWGSERVYYTPGDERVDVVAVRIRKPDGTVSEVHTRRDYDAFKGPGNLYYSRRFAELSVSNLEPGDVIEYAWRNSEIGSENFREGYFGDIWFFNSNTDVQRARYVLLTPTSMTIHARPPKVSSLKTTTDAVTLQDTPYTARVFAATDLKRVKTDEDMPGRAEVYDYVLVSTYKTWDEVGTWWWNLIQDQLVLNAEIRDTVAKITRGLTDDRAKIAAIHNWVVRNTRYVGIEFGVHGWKPYRTTLAMQRRFGDCKDKAALTKVMLQAAGIEAHMVLIRTRALGDVASEPANLAIFNHAISYVPKYDLFLDGTAEFSGTQELPFGDQGALAVVVQDGGKAKLVRTPIDPPGDNTYVRVLDVDLSASPPVTRGSVTATGGDAVYFRSQFANPDKRKATLASFLARTFPGASLTDATFEQVTDLEKPLKVRFTLTGGGFVKQLGPVQAIFPAGREYHMLTRYANQATRDQDLSLGVPHVLSEAVTYRLPPGRTVDQLPPEVTDTSPFGSFSVRVTRDGDRLKSEVSFSLSTTRITRDQYAAFRTWLQKADRAINQPIPLQLAPQ